jgi:5-methylcytosine-specific restriction endonuclease McrA
MQRSIPREPGKRARPWYVTDTRRKNAGERGYDARWQEYSVRYRQEHPLCVPCLLRGRVRGVSGGRWTGCVDHIVPVHSCPDLFWDPNNHASMCFGCHGMKTRAEPQESWTPNPSRIVVCGLPGTGKSTFARSLGVPYWDADERPELVGFDAIRAAREEWMAGQRGACVVIVASLTTASLLAARLHGVVRHMTTRHVERPRVPKRETPTYVE